MATDGKREREREVHSRLENMRRGACYNKRQENLEDECVRVMCQLARKGWITGNTPLPPANKFGL